MPEPGSQLFVNAITVTATATATHPEGADLSELPVLDTEAGTEKTETN